MRVIDGVRRFNSARSTLPQGCDVFDRMLLTTDGTVTTLLEVCTGEPIVTRTTRQSGPAPLDRLRELVGPWWSPDETLLDLMAHERLVVRRVVLEGERSGLAYVLAESICVCDRLPPGTAEGLRPGASIGRLLARDGVRTRRDILDVGTIRAGEDSEALHVAANAKLAWRTYLIDVEAQPAVLITETLSPGRIAQAVRSRSRVLARRRLRGIRSRPNLTSVRGR
jgi:chorismate-pyruvate lyase